MQRFIEDRTPPPRGPSTAPEFLLRYSCASDGTVWHNIGDRPDTRDECPGCGAGCAPMSAEDLHPDLAPTPASKNAGQELLKRAIGVSGLGAREFAREVLTRDPHLVWRWLTPDAPKPVPTVVLMRCADIVAKGAL